MWGPDDSGKTTAVLELARIARRHGFVPISVRFLGSPLAAACAGRAVFLIDDGDGSAWRRGLLDTVVGSPQAHVVVFTAREDVAGSPGAGLVRLSAAALSAAVRPACLAFDGRVRRAAERADGLPGRFVRQLLESRYQPDGRDVPAGVTAAERAPLYGAASSSWPDRDELDRLREQAASASSRLAAGRHASGDRELRQAMAGLARRGAWAAASDAALALAASLLKRGRPREAKGVLDAARPCCQRAAHDDPSVALATLAGVAWTDLGRLDEAERVLSAAAAAVQPAGAAAAGVALALARCRFWRGRFADADRSLEGVPGAHLDSVSAVRLHAMRARIAVGRLDFSRAMSSAAEAVKAAESAASAALIAEANCAAGFAHLAVDDLASLTRDVEACIAAATAARDPLRAFRARLLLAERYRRAGQRSEAQQVLRVLGRFALTRLPPILRRHYDLVVETMTSAESATAVLARHVTASGLAGLALFGPREESGVALNGVVEDAVTMLRECQSATEEDEEAALGRVCEHALRRLEAAAVVFFGIENRSSVRLAGHGSKLDASVAERASVAGIPVAPHRMDDRVECAVPIRCGGLVVGALAARWTMNRSPESPRALSVLTMAATAAAPLVQSMLAARARAAAPATHGLLGVSAAMYEVRRAVERAAARRSPCSSRARAAAARNWWRARFIAAGPRRDRPFRDAELRGAARRPRRGRAVRSRARRVHRRGRRARRRVRGGARRHAVPRRGRRAVAARAGQAAARDSGRRAAPDRRERLAPRRRADRLGDESRSAGRRRRPAGSGSICCTASTSFASRVPPLRERREDIAAARRALLARGDRRASAAAPRSSAATRGRARAL